jgi:Family of unknown function (DUF6184)
MIRATRMKLPLAVAIALGAAACGHPPAVSTTTLTAASTPVPVNEKAIDGIAATLCRREAKCENVGGAGQYLNHFECVDRLRGEAIVELAPMDCPEKIDADLLDNCLAEIRRQECGLVIAALDRVPACAKAALCPR